MIIEKRKRIKGINIGLIICFCLLAIYLFYPKNVITFKIQDDVINFSTREDNLICLTCNSDLIEYDKDGKEKSIAQTDVKYISDFGYLFLIKNDGSIVVNLDDDYNGDIIGKIPGAKSGCSGKDMIVIVTDNGDLFFYTDNSEISFGFNNTEIIDGWTKVKDVNNVTKAYVYYNSGNETIFTLNAEGEVYAIETNGIWADYFHKISEDLRIADIYSHGTTLMLLDEYGSLYQIGENIMNGNSGYQLEIDKIDKLLNVKKLSTSYIQGAAITNQGEVYVWLREGYGRGKAWEYRHAFEKITDGDWENIIISDDYLYVIKDDLVTRFKYKNLVEIKE